MVKIDVTIYLDDGRIVLQDGQNVLNSFPGITEHGKVFEMVLYIGMCFESLNHGIANEQQLMIT